MCMPTIHNENSVTHSTNRVKEASEVNKIENQAVQLTVQTSDSLQPLIETVIILRYLK